LKVWNRKESFFDLRVQLYQANWVGSERMNDSLASPDFLTIGFDTLPFPKTFVRASPGRVQGLDEFLGITDMDGGLVE
jgi:hypothetical protein